MSRIPLTFKPQGAIPRDLKLGVQMKRAGVGTGETVFDTVTVTEPAPKQLLLTGPAQIGGVFATVGSPATAEFYVMSTAVLNDDLAITITSSDPSIIEVANPTPTLIGAGDYARYDFSVIIHQGGSIDLTVAADGWVSDTIGVWANALAIGQDNFADAQAIVANDTTQTFQGALYPVLNATATREVGEPSHAGGNGEHSLWWKITPASGGTLSVDTLDSADTMDTVLAVYTGSAVDMLTEVASNDDAGADRRSQITGLALSGGVTYYICAAMYNLGSGVGEIRLHYHLDVPSTA